MRQEPHAIAILGPTASGKSDVAIQLAQEIDGEVISCDSRQVYRYMDIGTGKVMPDVKRETRNMKRRDDSQNTNTIESKVTRFVSSPPQMGGRYPKDRGGVDIKKCSALDDPYSVHDFICEGIRHHLLDIAHPNDAYNVAQFQKDARKALHYILDRKKLPILCGGTGLWAQALIEDFAIPEVPPNPELRERLSSLSLVELQERLHALDPERYKTIEANNPRRLIRAIEIYQSKVESRKSKILSDSEVKDCKSIKRRRKTSLISFPPHCAMPEPRAKAGMRGKCPKGKGGADIKSPKPLATCRTPSFENDRSQLSPVTWHVIILSPPRDALYANIERRLDERLQEGMLEEVQTLHETHGISWERLDNFGLEYRWISRHLRGVISYEDMREKLLIESRRYAKRQLTWLRRWERIGREMVWLETKEKAVEHGLKKVTVV